MVKCKVAAISLVSFSLLLGNCGAFIQGQGLTAEQSLEKMKVPNGFSAEIVASEPLVRQPVAIDFDDRGRLWVIQYLQYPNPNGLNRVAVDRFSRTKYDRVPEPPPHGPQGADRITILSDTDGDGRMDAGHDFVSGLNLATGFAFGHGGVFVLNVPYLLFYPDRNRDDVPDSDPEVLLTGFGMEDAHSVANSLIFGPDGWLYGCQGSTVTANIRGIEFQQGVWRYHPVTRQFELFCEGGGNSWGLDFDRSGNLFYSTNFGGYTLLHGVQGAYYTKSFAKHGALHNPFAYGYFEHAPHQNFQGGHVTVGGIVYQADLFPGSYREKYIAGDLLGHGVQWHSIDARGSTVATRHGGELLKSADTWFAPTDLALGPEGAIYVTDWHDERTAHPDPDAQWDRSNGRIYRITLRDAERISALDFTKLEIDRLLELHRHPNQWYVRKARSEIVRRYRQSERDSAESDFLKLRLKLSENTKSEIDEKMALEWLWSLHIIDGFDETIANQLLNSPHPSVRSWTVRLLGDQREISLEMAHRLDELAEQEPEVTVRQQLACSAARFSAQHALPMINANINRDIDNEDPYLPLLWWWAVEKHSVTGREEVLKRFVRPTLWKSKLGRDFLLTRLIRRYTAEASPEGEQAVIKLLKAAPDRNARMALWPHVRLGLAERAISSSVSESNELSNEEEFMKLLREDWRSAPDDLALLQIGSALGDKEILGRVTRLALDANEMDDKRVAMLNILSSHGDHALIGAVLALVEQDTSEVVQAAGVRVLAQFDETDLANNLLDLYLAKKSESLKSSLLNVLLSRPQSAAIWLEAVEDGRVSAASVALEQVRAVALLGKPELDQLVIKHWGKLQGATKEEKLAEVRRLNNDLRAAVGDASAGKVIFQKNCATCHQLFGEGTKLGPDLTSANRHDKDYLLISLVDPNSMIRKEYMSIIVRTTSGRILTGLPAERTDAMLVLVDAKGEKQSIPLSEVEEIKESSVSLMPENLYQQLKPSELRDLFAYLQSNP
jgi:putative membrane-bound dehydrogenase-like protein